MLFFNLTEVTLWKVILFQAARFELKIQHSTRKIQNLPAKEQEHSRIEKDVGMPSRLFYDLTDFMNLQI